MSYFVRLSCPDCTGEDPQGCFDGGTELIDEKISGKWRPKPFATIAEALAAGYDAIDDSIYRFEIEDETGRELKEEETAPHEEAANRIKFPL